MRILICDDDTLIIEQLKKYIESYFESNHLKCPELVSFTSGEALLTDKGEKDIVFLDIKMPKMDGIRVLEKRRRYEKNPKFVVLSCFNEYEYVREAMKLGAFDYLFKPLMEGKDIAAVIKEIQAQDNKGEQGEEQKNSSRSVMR